MGEEERGVVAGGRGWRRGWRSAAAGCVCGLVIERDRGGAALSSPLVGGGEVWGLGLVVVDAGVEAGHGASAGAARVLAKGDGGG